MNNVKDFLELLGLNGVEIQIYIFLLKKGISTVLQISREVSINRTSVYRICEKLSLEGFLRKSAEKDTTKYESASVDFLRTKIDDLEKKTVQVKEMYPVFKKSFEEIERLKLNKIKVIHYNGKDEVRQLIWNELEAKTEVLSLGFRTLAEAVGKDFIVHWWNENVRRGIYSKIIANPGTFELKDTQDSYTKEKYLDDLNNMEKRLIDEDVMKITEETFIYDDVFGIVQWEGDEVFGVEIYNKAVADQERELFKVLWKMARKMIPL
jgi:sugar-specific transcriptional regulator TrmB